MQSNNTLDGTNTTADGADISALDSRPQKAAVKSDLRSLSSEQILELVASSQNSAQSRLRSGSGLKALPLLIR
mgnify:CR=1 FL=1